MATLQSLQAKIAKLQAQAEAVIKKQSAGVIARIHALMAEHGLTVHDLGSSAGGKKGGPKANAASASLKSSASKAKYQDPKSGATWSGHGRAPGWIASAKNRDKFLVDGTAASVMPAAKKASKAAGNYVRGPQPAKYRDPKSGATWSGRGMAPAWLAGAKDRTKYLIDGAAAAVPEKKEGVVKKAAAKKVAAKKVAAKKVAAKKVTAKKAVAKKAAAPVKKVAAKKAPAKKAAAKKVAAKAVNSTPAVSAQAPVVADGSDMPAIA